MTLSTRLEDLEVTLEHMLMDVFVSFISHLTMLVV